jgi:hypothetical protein
MVAQLPTQAAPPPVDVVPQEAPQVAEDGLDGALVVVDAEPADDDGVAIDRIELVKSGLVRIHIDGKRYRLRRPFFGELKTLRLALADVSDDLNDRRMETQLAAKRMMAENERINSDDSLDDEARLKALQAIRREDRELGRGLTNDADDARIAWWSQAFEVVGLDGMPEQWPGWIVDARLPDHVLQHWRSAPLGRG